MHAYIDESGNTGFNLFDPAQPFFQNVAMSSYVDFDEVFQNRVQKMAERLGVAYLHGNELGVDGVEQIAGNIAELLEFSQVRFYFAAVNKRDIAAIKFYDAIFDPGENPAAPTLGYGIRGLKFILLFKFLYLLDEGDIRLFWDSMTSNPSPEAEDNVTLAIENALQRIDSLPDARSRQLIGDTLSWARENIRTFSIWTPSKKLRHGHLPNLFTFPRLLASISETAKHWDRRTEKIIHDQQSQFGQTLREWHALYERAEPDRIFHVGDTPIKFGDIRDSQFETRDSRTSAGLQVVDIVLWTFARTVSGKPLGPMAKDLFNFCFSPEDFFLMSLRTIEAEAENIRFAAMTRTFTEDQLLDATALVKEFEERRLDRMRQGGEAD